MTVSLFDSSLYGPLCSDSALASLFDDAERLRAMVRVEKAIAECQASLGLIPAKASTHIASFAEAYTPKPEALATKTAIDGTPVAALVEDMRAQMTQKRLSLGAEYLHMGVTSQDILDTAFALQAKQSNTILSNRLQQLIAALATLADRHRHTVMAARTRGQIAGPTSFGLRASVWLDGILRRRDSFTDIARAVESVQLGGGSGTCMGFQGKGADLAKALGQALDLSVPLLHWHSQRDRITDYANALATIAGLVGKIGGDLSYLCATEIGEVKISGGVSSVMPHKSNPIAAETLGVLSRYCLSTSAALQTSLLHVNERDGVAWTSEWMHLAGLVVATGRALSLAIEVLETMEVKPDRMLANLNLNGGAALAEGLSMALSESLSHAEARAFTREAAKESAATGDHIVAVLQKLTGIDLSADSDAAMHIGDADAMIDAVLAQV